MAEQQEQTEERAPKSSAGPGLWVPGGGRHCWEPATGWGPAVREDWVLHLVQAGFGEYTLDENAYPLAAGDVFISPPGRPAACCAGETGSMVVWWAAFGGGDAGAFAQSLPLSAKAPVLHLEDRAEANRLFAGLSAQDVPLSARAFCKLGCLYSLAALLIGAAPADGAGQEEGGAHYLENAVEFIQAGYPYGIGVDDVAAAVGLSRSHLYRVFVGAMGCSPIDYLTGLRMERARQLLAEGRLSVQQVAASVGMPDAFYFSRVFKKLVGCPPSQYKSSEEAEHALS